MIDDARRAAASNNIGGRFERPEAATGSSGGGIERRAAADSPFDDLIERLRHDRRLGGRIAHVRTISAREARFAEEDFPVAAPLRRALASRGVERLYSHQGEAIAASRRGEHVTVVTGTASGKTVCYNVPVIESLIEGGGTALYLFPTKALAQDQLRTVTRLLEADPELKGRLHAGVYDGDTTQYGRRKLRDKGDLILSNPDMLHAGILPNHGSWSRFFSALRYVVLDEIHAYRGIFGSNVGNVIRRLRRIARHYGADPRFLCCSATIANPAELAERLIGAPVTVVDRDGSPRGPKRFVLWNPPFLDTVELERRSSNVEGKDLLVALVREGVPTIVFSKARVTAELIFRYAREALERREKKLADRIAVYRGGYLPEERREIERRLFEGELLAVSSTNALELGIDVGTLGASILVGFPGTIASTWQQAGRGGRARDDSIVFLVAHNDPIDQYLVRNPEWFFGRSHENAIVDPENPYILERHLRCAAHELPVGEEDEGYFGGSLRSIMELLEEFGRVTTVKERWYWATSEYPAAEISLRNMSDATYTILENVEDEKEPRSIGTVDAISAPELLYPEAIYLHEGRTYFVRELDTEQRIAFVERRDVDYYTQAIVESTIRLGETRQKDALPGAELLLSEATVAWMTTAFKKIRFYGQDSLGWGNLNLPPQELETIALGIAPDASLAETLGRFGYNLTEGLAGVRNLLQAVLPLHAMCDPSNLGGVVESSNLGRPSIFIYDRFPKGLGLAEKGFDLIDRVLADALELVRGCPCREGCPSCVGHPRPPALHFDPDLKQGFPIPDKGAAVEILERLTK
ncbi:MAG: DEAD/DEAH box helicase [Candidatus Eisenbacteria bacterium]|nr:DEAD/DEAH box helicase [Candidatus Eisenbacteria bacterium]